MTDTFVISVPKTNWNDRAADMRSRLQTWEWRWKLPQKYDSLVLDFTGVEFMEPWALAMFTAYALEMRRKGTPVAVQLDESRGSNRYLKMMGIEKVVADGRSTEQWDESQRNTGLHVIRGHADVIRFVESAVRLGAGPDDETMDALKYAMSELGRNVVQHADSVAGGVAIAQHFPERGDIQIVLCDVGRGVRGSLKPNYPEIATDVEALKLALLPHVSGAVSSGPYAASDNAGLGLFFCKEIAWRAGGTFWLASERALVGVTGADADARRRVYRRIEPWPGTIVAIDLPVHGVADFAGLLELCRQVAQQARAQPGTAGLDVLAEPPDLAQIPDAERPFVVRVDTFLENVQEAAKVRDTELRPRLERGEQVFLDFGKARFVTQSFAHALLYDLFRIPGSLGKLSFFNCSKATTRALQTVAAYAATYRMKIL
jgi:anti-sigma regulatory factor (Ser/Thr protein kinase)